MDWVLLSEWLSDRACGAAVVYILAATKDETILLYDSTHNSTTNQGHL